MPSKAPAGALTRDAIKHSTEFTSIQAPFKEVDNAECKAQASIFVSYPKLGIFDVKITMISGAWNNEMLMDKSLNNQSVFCFFS